MWVSERSCSFRLSRSGEIKEEVASEILADKIIKESSKMLK